MKKRTKEDKTETYHILHKKVTFDYRKLKFLKSRRERRKGRVEPSDNLVILEWSMITYN